MSLKTGYIAEEFARNYLLKQGLTWIESNYRCRFGEIDVIMREGSELVFVEVRARNSLTYGGAAASVVYSKQRKLIKTAEHYLTRHKLYDKYATRFDVLALENLGSHIEWIKNAFGLDF